MASLNKVMLLGNLTRDPELKYSANGTPIATFGFAVNTKSGEKEDVLFIDITAFGRQAETTNEYLKKGSAALIEGRLQFQSWESQDGQKRSKHLVITDRIQFMSGKGETATNERPIHATTPPKGQTAARIIDNMPQTDAANANNTHDYDDDIPFVRNDASDIMSSRERMKFMA